MMSRFVEVPVKALALQHPFKYAHSALSVAKLREASVSSLLKTRLRNHLSALNLNPKYIEALNIPDFIAKIYGIECPSTEDKERQWVFSATFTICFFVFDDHFDEQVGTPEIVAKLSLEMRDILRALSRHTLSGLQGVLDDWPTDVPCKKAYLWLLQEAEGLRKGGAELLHTTFNDYCLGVESEIVEWAPDLHGGDMSAWNLDRCNEVRKRSAAGNMALAPLYVINKWMTREHYRACNDLLYDVSLIIALPNDVIQSVKRNSHSISMETTKILSADEIVQCHNKKVECLRKDILELDGDTRRFMEEIEISAVGVFLWQCNCKRYID